MKIPATAALLIALLTGVAAAAGFGTLSGKNSSGQYFLIDEVDLALDSKWDTYRISVQTGKKTKEFMHPCKLKTREPGGEIVAFSCSPRGPSPLAGVTYTIKQYRVECTEYVYTCSSGYGTKVPKRMYQGYWEC